MARAQTRTNLHSAQLTRILADLGVMDAMNPGPAFAEQLGQWVDFKSAIALSAVHSTVGAPAPTAVERAPAAPVQSLEQECDRMRGVAPSLPTPAPDASVDDARDYTPYRRYHQAQQRDLEAKVQALRARVRDAVGHASPRLRQLVALDASFEGVLVEREAKLLATVPALLEKRFKRLLQSHQLALADQQALDSPALWMKPGAWLFRFHTELQAVLMAELDLRLQPVIGLIEAFHHENTLQQA